MALVIDSLQCNQMRMALDLLRADRPIALPTETVYGLAARVRSEKALSRIFALKARPTFDPLIAHVSGVGMAVELCESLHEVELNLMQHFWPGPLTVLCRKSARVPDLCTGGSPWVALRCPAHPVFAQVLRELGEPLAAPSANRFQGISPTSYRDVLAELGAFGLDAVVDGGDCHHGIESTVVRLGHDKKSIEVLRPGACAHEDLDVFAKAHDLKLGSAVSVLDEKQMQHAPGQLAKHYSPNKKVRYVDRNWTSGNFDFASIRPHDLPMFVTRSDFELAHKMGFAAKNMQVLGVNHVEAAAKLFSALRSFDANPEQVELVAFAPSTDGLGQAIADRLSRAGGS